VKKICPDCGSSRGIHHHPAAGTGCSFWRHDDLGGLPNCRNRHNFATLLYANEPTEPWQLGAHLPKR
jgi:hypothetical protein